MTCPPEQESEKTIPALLLKQSAGFGSMLSDAAQAKESSRRRARQGREGRRFQWACAPYQVYPLFTLSCTIWYLQFIRNRSFFCCQGMLSRWESICLGRKGDGWQRLWCASAGPGSLVEPLCYGSKGFQVQLSFMNQFKPQMLWRIIFLEGTLPRYPLVPLGVWFSTLPGILGFSFKRFCISRSPHMS